MGAVFLENIMINPSNHGLVLVDWEQTVPLGKEPVRLKGKTYPKRLMGWDVWLAAKAMLTLPCTDRMTTFLKGCICDEPWSLLEEWQALLERQFGKPHFVTLEV